MNLELILWILAGIVVSEIIFIFWYKNVCKRKEDLDDILLFSKEEWFYVKIMSFLIGSLFIFIQYTLVFCGIINKVEGAIPHYEYLLYELGILLIIGAFFCINKLIANKIESQNKK